MLNYNYLRKTFLVMFLLVIGLNFIIAQPPVTTVQSFPLGYTIAEINYQELKAGEDFTYFFYLYNQSNGVKIDNTTVECYFHLTDRQGNLLMNEAEVYNPAGYWYVIINGSYVEESGWYYYGVDCQDGLGGALSGVFKVTQTGVINSFAFYIVLILLSLGLVMFGLFLRDAPITILGSIGLYFLGLYTLFFGVVGVRDNVYSWSIGLIILGLAFYISTKASHELITD